MKLTQVFFIRITLQGRPILHRSFSNTVERTLTVPSPERNITSPGEFCSSVSF